MLTVVSHAVELSMSFFLEKRLKLFRPNLVGSY